MKELHTDMCGNKEEFQSYKEEWDAKMRKAVANLGNVDKS